MESQEKKDLMDLAQKFGADVLFNYVGKADPNEQGARNLLEIVMYKLANAYDDDEIKTLNHTLNIMIDRGLDTSRRVETLAYDAEQLVSPTLLQAASNLENVSPVIFKQILDKEIPNLASQPNSGQNILIGRIQNADFNGFNTLLENNVILPPELAEEGLLVLTAVCSDSDAQWEKAAFTEMGKALIKMGPNLFNVTMFNGTMAFEDVLSEKGQEELASIVKTLKIENTIQQQDIVNNENADAIYDNTFSRGL